MNNNLMRCSLIFGCLLTSSGLRAGYGETILVENKLGARISPGWVVIRQAYSGPTIYSAHFPTKHYWTLVNLNGAPVGAVIEVLGCSPIPPGWVIIATRGAEGLAERQHYNIQYRIEKQYEVDSPMASSGLPPVIYGPVEFDWTTMDPANTMRIEGTRYTEPLKSEQEAREQARKQLEKNDQGSWKPLP